MGFALDDRAIAVKNPLGDGWKLKEVYPMNDDQYALAIKTPDGWTITPWRYPTQMGFALAVHSPQSMPRLLAMDCAGGPGPGNPGSPDNCLDCADQRILPDWYIVMIEGFPELCGLGEFNGTHLVRARGDCLWRGEIDETRRVQLRREYTGTWIVEFGFVAPDMPFGNYIAAVYSPCNPEEPPYIFASASFPNLPDGPAAWDALQYDATVAVLEVE